VGKKARKKEEGQPARPEPNIDELMAPWISMRTGLIVMAIVSIGFAIYIILMSDPTATPLLNRILSGVLFGGSLWVVFFGFMLINRYIRKK
jgi:hypothetical protein